MLGDRIKEILELKDMSQKQFALLLQIPYTTLSGYINDKREPDFKTLVDIANTLNVSIDYLLGNSLHDKPLDLNELSLLQYFRYLNTEQKDLIINQLKFMKGQNTKKN